MSPLEDFLEKTWVVETKGIKILKGGKSNTIRIVDKGGMVFEAIPKKPFPISHPYFIIFVDMQGNEICMIHDYRELDKGSIETLEVLLEKLYFMPKIKRVKKLETSGDEFAWSVETNKGEKEFRTRGRRSVRRIGGKIVIIDTNDNVYIAEDLSSMDEKSKRLLEAIT